MNIKEFRFTCLEDIKNAIDDKREYVLIVYRCGYVARVCITASSSLCIIRDVSNYLLNH